MAIRYISRLTGITLGDSGIKAQERQKIFVFELHRITISAFCKQIRRPVCFFVKSADCRHFILVKLLLLLFFLCI